MLTEEEIKLVQQYAAGGNVLDIGSACGSNTKMLAQVAGEVHVVHSKEQNDFDSEYYDDLGALVERLESGRLLNRVVFHHGAAGGILSSFKHGLFDFALIDVLGSSDIVLNCLEATLPLLRPKGAMVVKTYNVFWYSTASIAAKRFAQKHGLPIAWTESMALFKLPPQEKA